MPSPARHRPAHHRSGTACSWILKRVHANDAYKHTAKRSGCADPLYRHVSNGLAVAGDLRLEKSDLRANHGERKPGHAQAKPVEEQRDVRVGESTRVGRRVAVLNLGLFAYVLLFLDASPVLTHIVSLFLLSLSRTFSLALLLLLTRVRSRRAPPDGTKVRLISKIRRKLKSFACARRSLMAAARSPAPDNGRPSTATTAQPT